MPEALRFFLGEQTVEDSCAEQVFNLKDGTASETRLSNISCERLGSFVSLQPCADLLRSAEFVRASVCLTPERFLQAIFLRLSRHSPADAPATFMRLRHQMTRATPSSNFPAL